jgi:glycosyltransferase involved in cell wall biosynthesis
MVSVIIPNFNHGRYLKRRIDSILNQTYQNFELIILDDCSGDNSREILEAYRDHPKISAIVYNEKNSGSTFIQWKKGIELSKGTWIWIAESDDWCERTFLEELISGVGTEDQAVLAFCQSLFVTPDNKIITKSEAKYLHQLYEGEEFVASRMLGVNMIQNASMVLFRKAAFKNVPNDYEQMKYCGDWFIWVNICLQGKVFISGKYLNYYMRHENNVASKAIRLGYDFLEGNQVFHYIMKKIKVSEINRKAGLKARLYIYFEQKDLIQDKKIQPQVLSSMLTLDPSMPGLLKKWRRLKKWQRAVQLIKEVNRSLLWKRLT